jgi:hypothetical protein
LEWVGWLGCEGFRPNGRREKRKTFLIDLDTTPNGLDKKSNNP